MYNRRSHSPNTSSPTSALLAGFGLRPKWKASAHNSPCPRKTPRQDSENSKSDNDMPHPASLFDNDEDGSNMAADNEDPDLEDIGSDGGWPFDNNKDSINKAANNEDPDPVDERSDVGDRDGGQEGVNNREKFRSTTTIATKGCVLAATNSGLKLAHSATVSEVHKPFIPLDFKAIRQGFL
jgi:hypothetical protein